MEKPINIIDAILRTTNQAPWINFNTPQNLMITKYLGKISFDILEIGHSYASANEMERTRSCVNPGLDQEILVHAKAQNMDIKVFFKTGTYWL